MGISHEIEIMLSGGYISVWFIVEDSSDYTTIGMAVTDTQVLVRKKIPADCI